MPRTRRVNEGGLVYHVLNRANARMQIFDNQGDYQAFLNVMVEAQEKVPVRLLAYCLMPNHWHMVLWPQRDGDLSRHMQWLTLTHTQRWEAFREVIGMGHVYGSRFRNFAVEDDRHYLTVCRYVERNALRARLAGRAEEWPWSSVYQRTAPATKGRPTLALGPLDFPENWPAILNEDQDKDDVQSIRACVARGIPFGNPVWVKTTARRLGIRLDSRPAGRPRRS